MRRRGSGWPLGLRSAQSRVDAQAAQEEQSQLDGEDGALRCDKSQFKAHRQGVFYTCEYEIEDLLESIQVKGYSWRA